MFEELERIIANPEEDFSLAGLDTKSENEKQNAVASTYKKLSRLEEKIKESRMQQTEDKLYHKMTKYLEQMHLVNSYYGRIVDNYTEKMKIRWNKNNQRTDKIKEVSVLFKNYISSWTNIINQYLAYVVYFAKKYENHNPGKQRRLELADLIQEGNIGLMKAIERFDGKRRVKFSGYAGIIINGEISRAFDDKSRLIKTPAPFNKLCRDYERAKEDCRYELDREPTREEVYQRLGITNEQISFLEARRNLANLLELDKPIGENKKSKIIDFISNDEQSPLDILEKNELQNKVNEVLTTLNERERGVLISHFGLNGEVKTAKDIGAELDVSRITVQNIQNAALGKMKLRLVKYT